jgi:hypothetical protein
MTNHLFDPGAALAIVCTCVVLAAGPAAADCREDLAGVDRSFEETMERLEKVKNAPPAEQCAAYRAHVEIMTRAREVFNRCQTGRTRTENVGQMSDSIEDFAEHIRRRCG